VPWPTVIGEVTACSSALGPSTTCSRRCPSGPGCATEGNAGEHQCQHGMSFVVSHLRGERVLVYGVRGPKNTTQLNRYTSEGLKGRSVTSSDVEAWIGEFSGLLDRIDQEFASRQAEMLDPLHDPIRLSKQVNTIANRLVQMQSRGSSFEQQIDNAPIELKTLVKAADLLSDSFDLLTIYFNPHAATFGRRSAISLHGLITKLIAVFRIDDGGITRYSARIFLNGSCYRHVFVHESFKLIPFALLSNAVKYSMQGNIDVVVDDRRTYVELSVTSVGPPVDDDEKEVIFQKKGRGRWADKVVDGRGVGLYLAQLIARAHGTRISVNSVRTGSALDGVPLARNTFSLQLPIS
jgi:signal transduction histidine kinase